MKENVLAIKSFDFALMVIKEYRCICNEHKEYTLSKQFLAAGTSIGANIEEACGGQSKRDFLNKISIAYKEARETHYWLRLLKASDYIESERANILLSKVNELSKIISATIITTKNNLGRN